MINLYCEANGKLLAQAGFELAPSEYRYPEGVSSNPTWANNFPLASQYRFIVFTCCPEDDSNRVDIKLTLTLNNI